MKTVPTLTLEFRICLTEKSLTAENGKHCSGNQSAKRLFQFLDIKFEIV